MAPFFHRLLYTTSFRNFSRSISARHIAAFSLLSILFTIPLHDDVLLYDAARYDGDRSPHIPLHSRDNAPNDRNPHCSDDNAWNLYSFHYSIPYC